MIAQRKPRMLLVEDRQPLRMALTKKFTDLGVEVIAVEDGENAADAIATQSFDVILLDVLLPSKDGMTVLRDARAAGIQTPVMILTNYATVGLREQSLAAGAQEFFIKSDTSVESIVTTVAKYIPIAGRDQKLSSVSP